MCVDKSLEPSYGTIGLVCYKLSSQPNRCNSMTDFQPDATHVEETLKAVQKRQMVLPFLLFVAGHRPLAFVVGQLLYLAAPLATLLGQERLMGWALLLSDPDGAALLESALQVEQER